MLLVEVFVTRIKIFDQRRSCLITCMIIMFLWVSPMFLSKALDLKVSKDKCSYTFLVSLMLAVRKSLVRHGVLNSKLILVTNSSCGNTYSLLHLFIAIKLITPCFTTWREGVLYILLSTHPHIHTHTYAPPHTYDACTGSNSGTQ